MAKYTTDPIKEDTKLKFIFEKDKKDKEDESSLDKYKGKIIVGIFVIIMAGLIIYNFVQG